MASAVRRQIIGGGAPINKSRRRRPQIVGGEAGARLYVGKSLPERGSGCQMDLVISHKG